MATTTSPIKWIKKDVHKAWGSPPFPKESETHEMDIPGPIRCYIYGGYTRENKYRKGEGWNVQLRIDRAMPPNKLSPAVGWFKRLADAKDAAVLTRLMFLALCLTRNTKPQDMELYQHEDHSVRGF